MKDFVLSSKWLDLYRADRDYVPKEYRRVNKQIRGLVKAESLKFVTYENGMFTHIYEGEAGLMSFLQIIKLRDENRITVHFNTEDGNHFETWVGWYYVSICFPHIYIKNGVHIIETYRCQQHIWDFDIV